MASYGIIEGLRKDSIVYRRGAYSFRKIRIPMACARARIDIVIGEHEGHESTEKKIEISKVVSKLKRRAEFSQGTLHEIFDEEANQSEVGGYYSFPRMETF